MEVGEGGNEVPKRRWVPVWRTGRRPHRKHRDLLTSYRGRNEGGGEGGRGGIGGRAVSDEEEKGKGESVMEEMRDEKEEQELEKESTERRRNTDGHRKSGEKMRKEEVEGKKRGRRSRGEESEEPMV